MFLKSQKKALNHGSIINVGGGPEGGGPPTYFYKAF